MTVSREKAHRLQATARKAREAQLRETLSRRSVPMTNASMNAGIATGGQDGPDPNSCVGNCGGQAPGGCFCDEACCGFIDCCPDKFAACGGCDPAGGGDPLSCVGNCGGQAPGGCFCDEACCGFIDCCADKFAACGGCDPAGGGDPLSCVGNCGGQAPGGCFCDEACCGFIDCCADKFAACGGCDPSGGGGSCDPVGCPAGATAEGEACGSDTNGGCNSTPPIFNAIACGQTYCGSAWADGGTRDTDWYKLVLTNNSTVTLNGTAEFPLLIGIVNNFGNDSCAGVSQFLQFATVPANTPASVSASLSAGTWYLFVGNQGFSGNPCGSCNAYVISVECVCGGSDCPDVDGDDVVGVADLLAVISAWGPCACCPADVTGDGAVGVNDLLAVIGAWGQKCGGSDPLSCVGFCGGQAPGGCFCDEACCGFIDCCADKFAACGGCDPGGGGDPLSCVGNCGGQAPGGCFCDEACCGFIDCCADKFAACGGCDPGGGGDPLSCVGNCGGQAPGGCFCDEACCGFIDCCADKFAACGGCDPGGGGDPLSCVGNCGGQAPGGCFCDEACCGFIDCCADKFAACGGCDPGGGGDPLSCVGNCGGQAPGGCFCDEACCGFIDCCADKFAACGGCDPGGGGGSCTPVDCPPGALAEGESCGSDSNGGCNSTPPVFNAIACDDTFCGSAWADGGTRDTDWYKLVLTEVTTVTFSGTAEFPLLIGVVNNFGVDSCVGVSQFVAFGTAGPNALATVTTALNPGIWYLFVGNQGFSGNPCGSCNGYVVNLTCESGGDPGDPLSCVGFCGGQAPGGCFCDEACCGFIDCCADKFAACGGCDPGGGGDPLSCVGNCGGQAPGGCFCDEACCGFIDCCADKFAACGGCDPGGGGDPLSCVGNCGGQAPGGCFCDEACCGFIDCCADKFAACGGCDPGGGGDPLSCVGNCGGQAPGGCFCDEACCGFIDCCADKFAACGGCSPG